METSELSKQAIAAGISSEQEFITRNLIVRGSKEFVCINRGSSVGVVLNLLHHGDAISQQRTRLTSENLRHKVRRRVYEAIVEVAYAFGLVSKHDWRHLLEAHPVAKKYLLAVLKGATAKKVAALRVSVAMEAER